MADEMVVSPLTWLSRFGTEGMGIEGPDVEPLFRMILFK